MTTMSTSLLEELRRADKRFDRPAVPSVLAEYRVFMTTGRYPYIDSVVSEIRAKHEVPADLTKVLGHEVYLASGQYRLAKMVDEEAELVGAGYRPITDLVPDNGARVRLPDGITYRLHSGSPHGNWVLLPPGKRTNGVSLGRMVAQHEAYREAKATGQLRPNDPHVRMFAEVTP